MRPRSALAIALAASLFASLLLSHVSAVAQNTSEPTVVAEDATGDWGVEQSSIGPGGNIVAADLVEASIGMADPTTLNFIITVDALPPIGGVPEITRYIWDFTLDGDLIELDGKWTNYSRGVCDPTGGACPPPRDPGMQPFFVRGNCRTENMVQVCDELGIVQGEFDSGAGTITIPVPLELLQAKPGSVIGIGNTESVGGYGGGQIIATFSAFVSSGNMTHDDMAMTTTFTVPGGKKPKKTKGKRSPTATASPTPPSPTST